MCIVIQEVHAEGIVGKDGRLQSGDQLLEVNGIDLTNATHSEAREALKQPYPVYRLTVYREKSETACPAQKQGTQIASLFSDIIHSKVKQTLKHPTLCTQYVER